MWFEYVTAAARMRLLEVQPHTCHSGAAYHQCCKIGCSKAAEAFTIHPSSTITRHHKGALHTITVQYFTIDTHAY